MKELLLNELVKCWWVVGFLIFCAILYEQGLSEKDKHFQQLNGQLKVLQNEKNLALKKQTDLQLQINSQSDPDWIELTLMKGLGLAPEGEQKVYFYNR